MKLRYRPPRLQKGFRAFTTPAPLVQRVPTPPASETTATRPSARASRPQRDGDRHGAPPHLQWTGDGETVLRQADAAGTEILPDLFVLEAVEAVVIEQGFERSVLAVFGVVAGRQHVIEQGVDHIPE